MSYNAPGVYIKDIQSGSQSVAQASSSIGFMIGVAPSGTPNTPIKVGSWTEYIQKFANNLDSPFLADDYLSYAVHGFFNNGGKELFVYSLKKNGEKATINNSTYGITATAKYVGEWANGLKILFNAVTVESTTVYNVTVTLGSAKVKFINLALNEISSTLLADATVGDWLSVLTIELPSGTTTIPDGTSVILADGSEGDELSDSNYVEALSAIDSILETVTFVAIPGQTSSTVNGGIIDYCENNGLFPMLDVAVASEVATVQSYRMGISSWTGALCYPWGKMNDPLTNSLKSVPTCGHVMGVYARTIENRGIHKAPAGVDAVVRGFVEMEKNLTASEISSLNPIGVICIVPRPNAGIVVWGARSLNSTDSTLKYVSDGLLNLNIKNTLYNNTQFAIFEPNEEGLWSRVTATCKDFLESLRLEGSLKGTSEEAYYVVCDGSNNTEASIARGELNIEIGYAPVKPAEFVVIKLAHSIEA